MKDVETLLLVRSLQARSQETEYVLPQIITREDLLEEVHDFGHIWITRIVGLIVNGIPAIRDALTTEETHEVLSLALAEEHALLARGRLLVSELKNAVCAAEQIGVHVELGHEVLLGK